MNSTMHTVPTSKSPAYKDKHTLRVAFWALLCMLLLPSVLRAQSDLSSISGTISDSSGARIGHASVTVNNLETASTRMVSTAEDGTFTIPSLAVGSYELTASAPSFQTVRTSVELTLAGVTTNLRLHPGTTSENIEVSAESGAVALQQETFEISQSIDKEQLDAAPVSSNAILDVAALGFASQPGLDAGNELGNANHFGVAAETLIIAGLGNAHNLFLQDGIDNANLLTATINIQASRAATQEVSVLINGASARFRQPSTIDVITKSGSARVHGMAYDYLQNDFFNARNWFSSTTPTPTVRYNYFGGNLGGPLIKQRLFGFVDYSGQRSEQAVPSLNRVPTLAERGGDFSADSGTIYDPLTFSSASGTTAFNKNNIAGRISAFGQEWLNLYPLPNASLPGLSTNYTVNLPTLDNFDRYLGRVDWNIAAKHQFFATFARLNRNTGTSSISPGLFGIFREDQGTNVALGETMVVNPRVINVAKFGYNRLNFFRNQQGQSAEDYAVAYGLQGVNPPPSQSNPPKVSITNYTSFGDYQTPEGAVQNRYQLADELNWNFGKHTVYFGGEFIRTQFNGNWTDNNNGTYTFDGSATSLYNGKGTRSSSSQGNGLADLLLGFPNSGTVADGISIGYFRQLEMAGYIQDAWRLMPSLTLNLGLRYNFSNPPQDKNNHAGLFDIANTGVWPGTWNTNYNDWGPRFGFAWVPFKRTSIRGGYGIYYSPIQYQNLYLALQYAPNFVNTTYTFNIAQPVNIQKAFSGTTLGSISNYTIAKTLKDESAEEWNLSIEEALSNHTLFTVAYIGDFSRHSSARGDFNQPYGLTPGNTSGKLDLRPQPGYGPTLGENNGYNSNYNGLAVRLQQRELHGLSYLASYTFSRAMSIIDGDNNNIENIYHPQYDYAPASFDRTHNFQFSGTYKLPFGPGRRFASQRNWYDTQVIGGWNLSGVQHLATGQPISVTANANADSDSTSVHPVFALKICDPRQGFTRTETVFYNAACFVQPATGQYGTARNAVREPGRNTTDVSVVKNFDLERGLQLRFRAEAFGVFNHPNLSTGGSNHGFTNAPLLTAASGQRTMQFYLGLLF
jgi:hypothetical protein